MTRAYHSPTREAQTSATRRRVISAAQACFEERGYVGTTMRAIAQRAQVSVETVHQTAAKRDLLLAAFTLAVTGEDSQARLLDRPEPKAIFDDPDPVRRLRGIAAYVVRINTRVTPLWRVFEQAAAADAHVATEYADLIRRMHAEIRDALAVLAERGDLRTDRPADELADLLWLLVLPDQYFRLCEQSGWSVERYATWLAESMLHLLMGSDHHAGS
ncbi:TetR/AcrR family transcriptional regulator [Rugosimonospora africana]|nr:TetR/AcrR family transcriptional regulator [Rugosimonospora africana]